MLAASGTPKEKHNCKTFASPGDNSATARPARWCLELGKVPEGTPEDQAEE